MVYYTKRVFAPSYSRNKRFKASSTSTQKQLALLKRKVNALKPETKCAVVTGQHANVGNGAGDIQYISAIAQGVTKQTRLGDSIRLTRLHHKIQAVDVLTESGGNFKSRVLVVRDNAATGAIPTIAGTATSIMTNFTPLAMQNPATLDRFTIMYDRTYNGLQVTLGAISGEWEIDSKMNLVLDYVDTGATVSSAGKNSLYSIVLTSATTSTQDWNYASSLYFTDV